MARAGQTAGGVQVHALVARAGQTAGGVQVHAFVACTASRACLPPAARAMRPRGNEAVLLLLL